jgi:hypothetical protein
MDFLGTPTNLKVVKVESKRNYFVLVFHDPLNLVGGGSLESTVKSFGDGQKLKDCFAYEAINTKIIKKFFLKPHPFLKKAFVLIYVIVT